MIRGEVDFARHLREWDGFGVNYVETCQTADYTENPQDYGGFSTLSEEKRQEILDMIFGEDGLKPGIIKMFCDPFHQEVKHLNDSDPSSIDMSNYDHETTTKWLRYFAKEGLKRTRERGGDLSIITTLYGPPGFMTKQKFLRGRDLDPNFKMELAKYLISWGKYLKEKEGLPVRYLCLHNEGEDYVRWPEDGSGDGLNDGHDYNMYWPPEQVVDFLRFMRSMLDAQDMKDVGVAPGETTNWYRFDQWGYADAIADDEEALKNLGVITSHGFFAFNKNRWFADTRSVGIDIIREKRPELHAWVTSTSWGKMDVHFLDEFRHNIYSCKVNAIIPWACIQNPHLWAKGDPNPGTAFKVDNKGGYDVQPGYYFYKQLCRAGQPGMAVARVHSNDTQIGILGFSNNGTNNADAFVVLNTSEADKKIRLHIKGSSNRLEAYRTSPTENYAPLGYVNLENNEFIYTAPAGSATTFYNKA